MLIDPAVRNRAQVAAEAWEACADSAKVAVASAALFQALGLVPIFAAIAVLAEIAAKSHKRVAEDPPRDDYQERTSPRWRRFDDRFASDPTSRSAVPFIFATAQSTALLDAMVLAHERAEGAASQRAHAFVAQRLRERQRLALQAWTVLVAAEEASIQLAIALPDEFGEDLAEVSAAGEPLVQHIPQAAFDVLAGLAITPGDLAHIRIPNESVTSIRHAVNALGPEAGDFGRQLRRWASPSDPVLVEYYD